MSSSSEGSSSADDRSGGDGSADNRPADNRPADNRPVVSRPDGPGPALRAAREQRQIAIHEVAEVLNLPIESVAAIEANEYEALPSAVFTKGYIRAYAKLLELDSDPLVAAYPQAPEDTAEADAVVRDQVGEFVRAHPQWVLGGVGSLAVLLLVLLVIAVWPDDEPVDAQAPGSATLAEPPPDQAALAPELPAQQEPLPSAQPELAVASEQVGAPADIVTPAESAAPALAQEAAARRITPDGDDRLQFQFSEECWVEVKSGAGAGLYSGLGRPGQTLELVGRAPFRILLGYAPGVLMAFNDEPVALVPHTRNNVANLVLGQ